MKKSFLLMFFLLINFFGDSAFASKKDFMEGCVSDNSWNSNQKKYCSCTYDELMNGSDFSSSRSYDYKTGTYKYNGISAEMQWDTLHEQIVQMYVKRGYRKIPLIVYHNLNSTANGVQVDKNFKGVILLSGRSESVLKYVLYGEAAEVATQTIMVDGKEEKIKTSSITPYEIFLKAMDDDKYASSSSSGGDSDEEGPDVEVDTGHSGGRETLHLHSA